MSIGFLVTTSFLIFVVLVYTYLIGKEMGHKEGYRRGYRHGLLVGNLSAFLEGRGNLSAFLENGGKEGE